MTTTAPAPQRRRAKKPAKKSPIKYVFEGIKEHLLDLLFVIYKYPYVVIFIFMITTIINTATMGYALSQMQVIKPEPYKVKSTVNARG